MLHNTQINRLLTSIVASMVVLSAIGQVEVRLPEQNVEVLVRQLSTDCQLLMSDRAGQLELQRLLRGTKASEAESQARVHPAPVKAQACPPQLLVPTAESNHHFQSITTDPALLAPAATSRLRTRSPSHCC